MTDRPELQKDANGLLPGEAQHGIPDFLDRHTERPLAAAGLTSYRYRGRYGFVMIGARDDADALSEAKRSTTDVVIANLERWDGNQYAPVQASPPTWVLPWQK